MVLKDPQKHKDSQKKDTSDWSPAVQGGSHFGGPVMNSRRFLAIALTAGRSARGLAVGRPRAGDHSNAVRRRARQHRGHSARRHGRRHPSGDEPDPRNRVRRTRRVRAASASGGPLRHQDRALGIQGVQQSGLALGAGQTVRQTYSARSRRPRGIDHGHRDVAARADVVDVPDADDRVGSAGDPGVAAQSAERRPALAGRELAGQLSREAAGRFA